MDDPHLMAEIKADPVVQSGLSLLRQFGGLMSVHALVPRAGGPVCAGEPARPRVALPRGWSRYAACWQSSGGSRPRISAFSFPDETDRRASLGNRPNSVRQPPRERPQVLNRGRHNAHPVVYEREV